MEVVKYIKENSVASLVAKYHIRVKEYPDAYVLNYGGKTPKNNITNECRGLILGRDGRVISRSFDRFFDYEEAAGLPDAWETYQVFTKLDGSIIKIFNHNQLWYISTRHTMYAEGNVNDQMTFKELCLRTLDMNNSTFQMTCNKFLNPKCTYICELVAPENRVVVNYDRQKIYLLSVRENATGKYVVDDHPPFLPRLHPIYFESLEKCVQSLQHSPILVEGYVLYKDNVPTYKLKSTRYVKYAGIRGAPDTKFIKVVLNGELGEYIEEFPEDMPKFKPILDAIRHIQSKIRTEYETHYAPIEDRKEFCKAVDGWNYRHIAFTAREKNISFMEAFDSQTILYKTRVVRNVMTALSLNTNASALLQTPSSDCLDESPPNTLPQPLIPVPTSIADEPVLGQPMPKRPLLPTPSESLTKIHFDKRRASNDVPTIIVCIGMSGAGKSTLAARYVQNEGYVEISRDFFREKFFGQNYTFTREGERRVEAAVVQQWTEVSAKKINVIVSDTNLKAQYRTLWVDRATKAGYELVWKPMPMSLKVAYDRNLHRGYKALSRNALHKQWGLWLDYLRSVGKLPPRYVPDESLPKVVICDLDGTLADMGARNPYNWKKVSEDQPRKVIIDIVSAYVRQQNMEVIITSGRDERCKQDTSAWLEKYLPPDVYARIRKVYMRARNDNRDDVDVKSEIFWRDIAPHYNVVAIFDDRPKIVQLWKDIGHKNVLSVQVDSNDF